MQTPIPVAERKIQNKKLKSDQNSVSYLFFNLPHPRLSLISFRKNTYSNQDLRIKSWLELAFLRRLEKDEGRLRH